MAEHYSLELLRHSGGISEYRYKEALEWLARWSDGAMARSVSQQIAPEAR